MLDLSGVVCNKSRVRNNHATMHVCDHGLGLELVSEYFQHRVKIVRTYACIPFANGRILELQSRRPPQAPPKHSACSPADDAAGKEKD